MTTELRDDPIQAARDAHMKPRDKGAAPHWVRCTWYRDWNRCLLAEGHPGEHTFPKESEA